MGRIHEEWKKEELEVLCDALLCDAMLCDALLSCCVMISCVTIVTLCYHGENTRGEEEGGTRDP
jgi:hypothetical protein